MSIYEKINYVLGFLCLGVVLVYVVGIPLKWKIREVLGFPRDISSEEERDGVEPGEPRRFAKWLADRKEHQVSI